MTALHPPTRTEQVALALLADRISPTDDLAELLEFNRAVGSVSWARALHDAGLAIAAYEGARGIAGRSDIKRRLKRIIAAYDSRRAAALGNAIEAARRVVGL